MAEYNTTLSAAGGLYKPSVVQQEKLLVWGDFHVLFIVQVVVLNITTGVSIVALFMEPPTAYQAGAGITWKDEIIFAVTAVSLLLGHSLHRELLLAVLDSRRVQWRLKG